MQMIPEKGLKEERTFIIPDDENQTKLLDAIQELKDKYPHYGKEHNVVYEYEPAKLKVKFYDKDI